MGRPAQREWERERAAKCSQSIEKFVKKKSVEGNIKWKVPIADIKSLYKEYRQNITDEYHVIVQHAIRMAEAVNTQPSQPRVGGKQIHRQNTKAA